MEKNITKENEYRRILRIEWYWDRDMYTPNIKHSHVIRTHEKGVDLVKEKLRESLKWARSVFSIEYYGYDEAEKKRCEVKRNLFEALKSFNYDELAEKGEDRFLEITPERLEEIVMTALNLEDEIETVWMHFNLLNFKIEFLYKDYKAEILTGCN